MKIVGHDQGEVCFRVVSQGFRRDLAGCGGVEGQDRLSGGPSGAGHPEVEADMKLDAFPAWVGIYLLKCLLQALYERADHAGIAGSGRQRDEPQPFLVPAFDTRLVNAGLIEGALEDDGSLQTGLLSSETRGMALLT